MIFKNLCVLMLWTKVASAFTESRVDFNWYRRDHAFNTCPAYQSDMGDIFANILTAWYTGYTICDFEGVFMTV